MLDQTSITQINNAINAIESANSDLRTFFNQISNLVGNQYKINVPLSTDTVDATAKQKDDISSVYDALKLAMTKAVNVLP